MANGSSSPRRNGYVLEAILVLSALGLALAAAVAGWGLGHYTGHTKTVTVAGAGAPTSGTTTPTTITPAPTFSADELAADPTDSWITNGGSTMNQRYSPLNQIDTANVSKLKGVWHLHLKSGDKGKYSAEGQPLVYKGVIYVPTGADDVFAVDVATGKVMWTYHANLDQKIGTVCCGWDNRGVAIGEGKVFSGQLDGSLVALDMKTGKKLWSTQVARWQDGYTITAAPLYWDGRVYTGVSGGEYGVRGRITAMDAATGKILWRFYTVPGPGEVGHDTWPKNDRWKHGGASIWQTPAVDPKLGLLYFSTSNASPDFNGAVRKGDNLFASSIVAIDAKTGKYKWHFQQVHHDLWDYDSPSPVVLFDVNGKHAIAEVAKTGFVYILDRANGKPLYGIEERAVPQRKDQATSKTQPFPVGDPTVRQAVPPAEYAKIKAGLPKGTKYVNGGKIFTPYGTNFPTVSSPSALGGTNWPPSSYNPNTHYLYVCGSNSDQVFTGGSKVEYANGKRYLGSAFAPVGTDTGTFSAMDMTNNRKAWSVDFPDRCYSGSLSTGGGLVFVGRNDGRLQAYDAAKGGKALWTFQTGAGANNVPTTFQQNGNQYLVFYAGGSALGATPHGDDLWLFSLAGTITGTAKGRASGGILHTGERKNTAALGANIFADNCSSCHGDLGQGGNGGPNLQNRPGAANLNRVIDQVTHGGGGMPPFKGQLTKEQIKAVANYVTSRIAKKK